MKRESLGYTVLFVFVTTFVLTGALSWVHTATEPIVRNNELERYQRAVLEAAGLAPESQAEVFAAYSSLARVSSANGVVYITDEAYAVPFTGPGVWGDIEGILGVATSGEYIVGLEILNQNETPGLGGRIMEERFLRQFRGERLGTGGRLAMNRGTGDADPANGAVDGISGATGTSRAVHRIVNAAIAEARGVIDSARE